MSSWPNENPTIGYVVERYPRYADLATVNEILAHEAAGIRVVILSLRPPSDTHFHGAIGRVTSEVVYVHQGYDSARALWEGLQKAAADVSGFWSALGRCRGEDVADLGQALELAAEARARGLAHLHATSGGFATHVARMAARFLGVRYTFTARPADIHGPDVDATRLRLSLADAAAAFTASDQEAEHLRTRFGDAAERVQRIRPGLDLTYFPYRSPLERPPRIVSMGLPSDGRAFAELMAACSMLARSGRRFEVRILGIGPDDANLNGLIERAGLAERVQLMGLRPAEDTTREIQGAALVVAPSASGSEATARGLPSLFIEAMALGTPCLCTDELPGIAEIIRNEETGLVVSQRSESLLAGAIERLLLDPTLRDQLAARARRLIEAEWDVTRTTHALRSVFYSTMSRPRGNASADPLLAMIGN